MELNDILSSPEKRIAAAGALGFALGALKRLFTGPNKEMFSLTDSFIGGLTGGAMTLDSGIVVKVPAMVHAGLGIAAGYALTDKFSSEVDYATDAESVRREIEAQNRPVKPEWGEVTYASLIPNYEGSRT